MSGHEDKSTLAYKQYGCRHSELVQLTVSLFLAVFEPHYVTLLNICPWNTD